APAPARASAIALPMPRLAPVTRARRPSRENIRSGGQVRDAPDLAAIDVHVAERQIARVLNPIALGDSVEGAIHQTDVGDLAVGDPHQREAVLALLAGNAANLDVAGDGGVRTLGPFLVLEVDFDDGARHLAHA